MSHRVKLRTLYSPNLSWVDSYWLWSILNLRQCRLLQANIINYHNLCQLPFKHETSCLELKDFEYDSNWTTLGTLNKIIRTRHEGATRFTYKRNTWLIVKQDIWTRNYYGKGPFNIPTPRLHIFHPFTINMHTKHEFQGELLFDSFKKEKCRFTQVKIAKLSIKKKQL